MKRSFAAIALAIVLSPASATAAAPTNECVRLMRQIHHFEAMADRAEDQDNDMWKDKTLEHVGILQARFMNRCPDLARDHAAEAARAFVLAMTELMKVAGRMAVTYFTFGAF